MQNAKQHLILNKGGERFVFRYERGQEEELITVLLEHAADHRTDFDWIDAAVLRLKLTQEVVVSQQSLPPASPGNRAFPFCR